MPTDFSELLDEHFEREEPHLRAYLRRRIPRHEDCRDYVQEVYARVLAAPPREDISSWAGLFKRVASNLLIDRFRRDVRREAAAHVAMWDEFDQADEQPSIERTLIARERLAAVSEALKEVSPVARSVFLLVRVEGLSHREAAEKMGLDVKIAYRHVASVLNLISRKLAQNLSS